MPCSTPIFSSLAAQSVAPGPAALTGELFRLSGPFADLLNQHLHFHLPEHL